ncbi:hypothetical protein GGI07_002213 [Coemansia sp. Benny D115]|nr:hypothetical protein GGI07_002213 [Coemansia sp. Benny D115]
MSSLHVKLAVWNEAANPTYSRATATAAFKDGIACGHLDGRIWLYSAFASASDTDDVAQGLSIYPRCLLSNESGSHSVVLLKTTEISSPSAQGTEEALLAVYENGDVILWAAGDGRCISRVRVPLRKIRPTSVSLQAVDYQSAAEDLLFVTGDAGAVYVLSYPSLEFVYEWQLPHPEWITAQVVRKRKDHFRSELITCTGDGIVRIWSYDEFALSQQDVSSRTGSPNLAYLAETVHGSGTPNTPRSAAQSIRSDVDGSGNGNDVGDSAGDCTGVVPGSMFHMESEFASFGREHAATQLVINPYNEDEFLAVSPSLVRLFASRDSELHELLRWKPQRSNSAAFAGAGFVAKSDIVFWDAIGNVFSVCSSFTVEGGSAGIHLTRAQHVAKTGDVPKYVATSLDAIAADSGSVFARASGCVEGPVHVIVAYTSSPNMHTLSVVFPMALSTVSGSANKPHVEGDAESQGGKTKSWLGRSSFFLLRDLWSGWLDGIRNGLRDVTCATIVSNGCVALGFADGTIRIVSPMALLGAASSDSDSEPCLEEPIELHGHKSAVTMLFEWVAPINKGGNETAGVDGRVLISASKDLTLKLWNTKTHRLLASQPTQSSPVTKMVSTYSPAGMAGWGKESRRESQVVSALQPLLLAVSADNSTAVWSMSTLGWLFFTPPSIEAPLRAVLCRSSGDMDIEYSDGHQQRLPLSEVIEGSANESDDGSKETSRILPAYSISLVHGASCLTRSAGRGECYEGGSGSDPGCWAQIQMVPGHGGPSALVLDVEAVQLYGAVSKVVPEGAGLEEMRALLADEKASARGVSTGTGTGDRAGDGSGAGAGAGAGVSDSRYVLLSGGGRRGVLQPLHSSQMLMSVLCSWNVSKQLDKVKRELFGMRQPQAFVSLGIANSQCTDASTVVFPDSHMRSFSGWCLSRQLNAQRMMALLVLSRSTLQGDEKKAVEIINFYVGKLAGEIGRAYKSPSLDVLARYWQSPNDVGQWLGVVARCGPGAVDAEELCALTIVCAIGSDFPALLPLTARSMAASMLQSLVTSDRAGEQTRTAAIELLARGFGAFKAHVDGTAVVRRLIAIVASASEESHEAAVSFGLVAAARAALLRISAAEMSLVASTAARVLQSDATGVREKRGALQLVGLVAQKYAAAAYPFVAGLAAAIVQVLDPKRATARRQLLGAAAAAIQGLVGAYPSVAFHAQAQCLAVGGADGRCVAYDLRTATRTAVYGGPAMGPVTAVAVSPPGDRVASFTLGDGVLSVWDPAPSALAMFARSLLWAPGSSDEQAGGGNGGGVAAEKTMVIPAAFMQGAGEGAGASGDALSVLHAGRLAWTGDRTVLLQVRDASFSLSL